MKAIVRRLINDESGASAAEYAILASIIAVAVITTVYALGLRLDDMVAEVLTVFQSRTH